MIFPAVDGPEIVLDLSRLLSRVLHTTPTGVDRVEMAYARGLLELVPDRLAFGAVHPIGGYGRIPSRNARAFLDIVSRLWRTNAADESAIERTVRIGRTLRLMRPRPIPPRRGPRVVLQSSPHHLTNIARKRAVLRREQARFICLLHDMIPVTHPEYARPGGASQHLRRVATIAATADAVIANSRATLDDFTPYLRRGSDPIPAVVAHLGLDALPHIEKPPRSKDRPYFVCLGTIEPRKNHLLLLHVWRELVHTLPARDVPRLIVIGRRGWENEQVVDMLERCPGLADFVEERAGLRDEEVGAAIAGARALLLPSFAEGFGMPVPEALHLGTPVICSDLPALREAGGDVPEYLDPLDGPAWRDAVITYADAGSSRRRAQCERITRWTPTTWRDHLAKVLELLHRLPA